MKNKTEIKFWSIKGHETERVYEFQTLIEDYLDNNLNLEFPHKNNHRWLQTNGGYRITGVLWNKFWNIWMRNLEWMKNGNNPNGKK